jgi:ADP-heptose:LPS heptosyltransferase
MNYQYKNLIYFQNGSIGDFLMTIFFLENIYLNNRDLNLFVVVPKNYEFLSHIAKEYPYLNIILANRKSTRGLAGVFKLGKFIFSKNLVITAPTPGKLSFYIKIMAKKISFFKKSQLVGFEDGQKINKFIYSRLLKYNTKIIYSDFLKVIIEELGFEVKKELPELRYSKDKNILLELGLEEKRYIVFNPLAATKGRSFKLEEISEIIDFLKICTPEIKIVLTGGGADGEILNLFKRGSFVLVNLEVSKLCTLLDNSKLFIGVDTGTSHVASFLGVKSLVVAQNGTPNWLPYYNKNATILYKIKNCQHNIFEGRDHLEDCRSDVLRCLGYVDLNIIKNYLGKLLK